MAVTQELNFRDYWRIIRRKKFLIATIFMVTLGISVYQTRKQIPIYQASSTIKLEQRQTVAGALLASSIPWSSGDPMESTARLIENRPIAEKTAEYIGRIKEGMSLEEKEAAIGEVYGSVATERIGFTNLIKIVATHTDPILAQKIANGTAEVFVQWDLSEKNKQARKVREFIENQLIAVEKQLRDSEERLKAFKETEVGSSVVASTLSDQLIALKTQLTELSLKATERHPEMIRLRQRISEIEQQLREIPGEETEYARLIREVRLNEGHYTLFKQKFEEARIAEAEKVSDVSVVDYANPGVPLAGKKQATLLLGGFIGLLLGFISAFVAENLDTSISTIEAVEELLSVPVLTVVPYSRSAATRAQKRFPLQLPFLREDKEIDHQARLVVHDQPKSAIAESYRSLRTNLKFSEGITGRSLLLTSSGPQEGKTAVLTNLGLSTAQMGSRTLMVSSDLRRPSLCKTFRVNREPGLCDVLSGGVPWQEVIRGLSDMLLGGMSLDEASKTPGLDHIFILPAGRMPLNPSELLGSKEMDTLIEELKKSFDVVLYDSPPILPVTDAALLAPKVDGVVIVYEIGRTARNALLRAKNQIEAGGGKVIGIVLNHLKAETEVDTSYAYYHYKYYGREMKEKKTKA